MFKELLCYSRDIEKIISEKRFPKIKYGGVKCLMICCKNIIDESSIVGGKNKLINAVIRKQLLRAVKMVRLWHTVFGKDNMEVKNGTLAVQNT